MRTASIERQSPNGEKIRVDLMVDIDHKIDNFADMELVIKAVKAAYDDAIQAIFTNDSTDILKKSLDIHN